VIPLDVNEVIRLLEAVQKLESSGKAAVSDVKAVGQATRKVAKRAKKTAKRAPSAYNLFMAKELKRLRKKHPRTAQPQLMKKAAAAWRKKKKGGKR